MDKQVLFLTLRVFSATGGIEKVCRVFSKALTDVSNTVKGMHVKVFSMYDADAELIEKYIASTSFTGFNTSKIKFVVHAFRQACKSDIIIISHINLLSIGYVVKLLFPQKKILLFAHGIEVWGNISYMRKNMLHKCDNILAVSRFTKNKLMEKCSIANEKITVLNNCLDPFLPLRATAKDSVLLKKYGLSASDNILITLTRMSSKELYKGYDQVLCSLKKLKEKIPGVKYLIVGRYDDKEKRRLDVIISKYNLEKYVVFTGYIPDALLAAHYSLADVYVMPSKKEGFGIVFIEAMYYGLPVIAGNKDGSTDAVNDGKLGVLVNPDDQGEIEAALEKVMLNKNVYKPDKKLLDQLFSYTAYKEKCAAILANY